MYKVEAHPCHTTEVGFDREVYERNDGVVDEGEHPPADEHFVCAKEVAIECVKIKQFPIPVEVVNNDHDGERHETRSHHVVNSFVVLNLH